MRLQSPRVWCSFKRNLTHPAGRLCAIIMLLLTATPLTAGEKEAPIPDITSAKWIWNDPGAVKQGVPDCYFRKHVNLPAEVSSAIILITADNGYDLYVNGSMVGGDHGYDTVYWKSIEKYDVAHLLESGRNVIGVRGRNLGGPAGILVAGRIASKNGETVQVVSNKTWRVVTGPQTGWASLDHDDSEWPQAAVVSPFGSGVWSGIKYPGVVSPAHRKGSKRVFIQPGPDFDWPEGIVFVKGRAPESSTKGAAQTAWRVNGSRAYLEFDTIGPSVPGHQLYALKPARPDTKPRLLVDAGKGLVGSPTVSFDGRTIYFSMAPEGEKFYHVYSISADGKDLKALTSGPFHDFDPAPMPGGRIVFSSTRIGSRDEYHANTGRSLFTMKTDGSDIKFLTAHIVGDNEPRVTAEGQVAFIRCDNFMERAKVETQIHIVRPDGTGGQVLLGADRKAIGYDRPTAAEMTSLWLRHYGFGSPAPLPDGRVASISTKGLTLSGTKETVPHPGGSIFDAAPMPDGRLLCTLSNRGLIGVLDPANGNMARVYQSDTYDVHSPACLEARSSPPHMTSTIDTDGETGFLFCQNVFYTKQTNADVSRIMAVRIIEGRPMTLRSGNHQYCHVGVDAVELGTVPLSEDGSFYVEVPADRAIAIQAIDAEGRSVINEQTWLYVRPGETRTCTGCHNARQAAPGKSSGIAQRTKPVKLLGSGRPHHYRGNNAANGGVLNLQFDRHRETATIDLYRSITLSQPKPPPGRPTEVERLCRQLGAPDDATRASAANRLGIFRDRAAVKSLLKTLKDRSPAVRMNSAIALASCGNRSAVKPLVAAVGDSKPKVVRAAQNALEHLTGHSFSNTNYGGASAPGQAEWRAWLKANEWSKIEQANIDRIDSADPAGTIMAIQTLGHIGGEAGKRALRNYLANSSGQDLRAEMAAMRGLGHLKDEDAVGLLGDILNRDLVLRKINAKHSAEFGWMQAPTHRAAAAAEALGWIGSSRAEDILIKAYSKLADFWQYTRRCGDHSWLMGCHPSVLHYRITESLDAIGSTRVAGIVPKLLRSVPIDTDRGLLFENDGMEILTSRVVNRSGRADAVIETCLSVLGDKQAEPVSKLKKDVTASPPAQKHIGNLEPDSRAAHLLSVICIDPSYAPRIRTVFNRHRAAKPSRRRSWICFMLARTLGKLKDVEAVPSLVAALDKDRTEASFGRPDPPNTYLHLAMTPCYRAAAAYALGKIGDRKAVPTLIRAVENFDNAMDVRDAAAKALGLIADTASLAGVEKLAHNYPEVATRRSLERACESIKQREQGKSVSAK